MQFVESHIILLAAVVTPSNSDSLAHDDADAVEANGSCIQKRRKRLSSHEKEKVEVTRRPRPTCRCK